MEPFELILLGALVAFVGAQRKRVIKSSVRAYDAAIRTGQAVKREIVETVAEARAVVDGDKLTPEEEERLHEVEGVAVKVAEVAAEAVI